MVVFKKSLFFPAKDKALARKISIKSPAAFRQSITTLRKGGVTLKERRGLVLAQNRAAAQLRRKNLSRKEFKQFSVIASMSIPRVSTKKRRK